MGGELGGVVATGGSESQGRGAGGDGGDLGVQAQAAAAMLVAAHQNRRQEYAETLCSTMMAQTVSVGEEGDGVLKQEDRLLSGGRNKRGSGGSACSSDSGDFTDEGGGKRWRYDEEGHARGSWEGHKGDRGPGRGAGEDEVMRVMGLPVSFGSRR